VPDCRDPDLAPDGWTCLPVRLAPGESPRPSPTPRAAIVPGSPGTARQLPPDWRSRQDASGLRPRSIAAVWREAAQKAHSRTKQSSARKPPSSWPMIRVGHAVRQSPQRVQASRKATSATAQGGRKAIFRFAKRPRRKLRRLAGSAIGPVLCVVIEDACSAAHQSVRTLMKICQSTAWWARPGRKLVVNKVCRRRCRLRWGRPARSQSARFQGWPAPALPANGHRGDSVCRSARRASGA